MDRIWGCHKLLWLRQFWLRYQIKFLLIWGNMEYNLSHRGKHHQADLQHLGLVDRFPRVRVKVKDSGELGEMFQLEHQDRDLKVKVKDSGEELGCLSRVLGILKGDHSHIHMDPLVSIKGIHKVDNSQATLKEEQATPRQEDLKEVSRDIHRMHQVTKEPHRDRQVPKVKHHLILWVDILDQPHTHREGRRVTLQGHLGHRDQYLHILWEDPLVQPLTHRAGQLHTHRVGQHLIHRVGPRDSLQEHLHHLILE